MSIGPITPIVLSPSIKPKSPVVENLTLFNLFGSILNKTRLIVLTGSKVFPANLAELFLRGQALLSASSNSAPSALAPHKLNHAFTMKMHYISFKHSVKQLNQLPMIVALRRIFRVKQTCDFTLTLHGWLWGNRSNSSFIHQTVNTTLAWIPFIVHEHKLLESTFALNASALLTLGCLTYSTFQDFRQYNAEKREKSPTVQIIHTSFSYLNKQICGPI